MARWVLGWLLLIVTATAGMYWGTNALVGGQMLREASYAMQPLGELGSPVCSDATRALVAAGDGAASGASTDQRAAWDRAADRVLQACGKV